MKASKMYRAYLLLAIMLMSAIYSQSVHAVGLASPIPGPYMPSFYWKHGAVFTRALALDNGYPQYVEIDNATGAEVGYIGSLASPEWQEAWQTSADTFHAYQARYDHHMTPSQQNADLPKLMSVEEYNQTDFVTIDDKPVNKQAIGAPYTHVLVVNEKRIFSTSGEFLIVDKYQLDPSQSIAGNSKSLLINPKGQVIFQSPNNIGFRVGFYGDPGEPMIEANKRPGRESGDKIFGPLAGVPLQMGFTGGGVTDEEGKYTFTYLLPPCPGFSFHYTTTFWATMYYQRFNPYHDGIMPYVMMRDDYDFCMGYEVYDYRVIPIKASISTYKPAIDFPVDLIVLNGFASITEDGKNVPIAEPTRFVSYKETGDKQLYRIARQKRDFDGDGQLDTVLLGSIEYIPADDPTQPDIPVFNPAGEDIQGVWLSAADLDAETQAQLNSAHAIQQQLFELRQQGEDDPDLVSQLAELDVIKVEPDFSRQADWSDNFDDFGKLEQISKEDLLKTDIYVVRSSNGELVYEREGIPEDELDSGIKDGRFNYTVKLRGGLATELSYKTYQDFSQWQIDGHIQPKFQQRQADHLRAGELVEVYAINRVTGYMGVMPVRLKAATGGSLLLSFPIDELKMTRPNLKVWSTRKTRQELGLNQGQIDEYLIGNEGAGLTQDMFLALYTEWTNQDGSPIPAVLGDFGYTARLASLVDDQVLGEYNASSVSQFSVLPGIQLQALMLFRDNVDNQRFYVQVHAKPEAESPDFSSTGRHQGKTGQRPDEFVPFKVPVFDEDATSAIQDTLDAIKKADPGAEWHKADPIYHYVYRPEYQFSQYTLQIDEVNRKPSANDDPINLKEQSVPFVSNTDELLDLLHMIAIDENLPLDAWSMNSEQELLFDIDGVEIKALVNKESQTVTFDDLGVLEKLAVEDFVTIRLFANNDTSNALWQYSVDLGELVVMPPAQDETGQIEMTADEAEEVQLTATFVGIDGSNRLLKVLWGAYGEATFTESEQRGMQNVFLNSARFSTTAGTVVQAYAKRRDEAEPVLFAPVKIIPGKPATIELSRDGETAIGDIGKVTLNAIVKDKFGNLLPDGTHVEIEADSFNVDSDYLLKDGQVKFELTGGLVAGEFDVTVKAGGARATESIIIHDIQLSVSAPAELNTNSTATINVTASSGMSLAGVTLELGALGLILPSNSLVLDDSGTGSVTVKTGSIRQKAAFFVGTADKGLATEIEVIDPSPISADDTIIIGDKEQSGEFVYESQAPVARSLAAPDPSAQTFSGMSNSAPEPSIGFAYKTNTNVNITGQQGEEVDLTLVDYMKPPLLPELDFPLQRAPVNNLIKDSSISLFAVVEQVDLERSFYNGSQFGLSLQEHSKFKINYDYLSQISDLGLVLNVKPSQKAFELKEIEDPKDPGVLIEVPRSFIQYKPLGLHAYWNEDGTLSVEVNDAGQVQTLTTQAVTADTWHKLAIHLLGNKLVVQLDEKVSTLELSQDVQNDGQAATLLIGEGFEGSVSQLKVYDWQAEKLVSFADGAVSKKALIGSDGKAKVAIKTSALSFAHIRERREHYYANYIAPNMFLQMAYASDEGCDLDGPNIPEISYLDIIDDFGQVLSQAERMAQFLADCDLKPRMREVVIKLQNADGVWDTSVAVAELIPLAALYAAAKTSEYALALGPDCAMAAATGETENIVGIACDFALSLTLIGDVRDVVYHSWYWFWDTKNDDGEFKFDKVTYTFAILGVASNLLEATGVGTAFAVVADVAIAGCKSASKVFGKASRFLEGVIVHIDRLQGKDYYNLQRLTSTLRTLMPVLQVTAAVVLLKEDMVEAFELVRQIELAQVSGWIKYAHAATKAKAKEIGADFGFTEQAQAFWVFEIAYAIDGRAILKLLDEGGTLKAFVKVLDDVAKKTSTKLPTTGKRDINKLINSSVAKVGDIVDAVPEDMASLIAKDEVLTSLAVVFHIGEEAAKQGGKSGEGLIASIMKFTCTPGTCGLGGASSKVLDSSKPLQRQAALAEYLGQLSKFADLKLSGKLTDQAYLDLEKVISQFDKRINIAKGASEQLAQVLRVADKFDGSVVKGFEVDVIQNGYNRVVDAQIEIGSKLINFESKAWEPEFVDSYLLGSLGAKVRRNITPPDATDGVFRLYRVEGGFKGNSQMLSDLIANFNNSYIDGGFDLTKVDRKWLFDHRLRESGETPDTFYQMFKNHYDNDAVFREEFFELFRSKSPGIQEKMVPLIAQAQKDQFITSFPDKFIKPMFETMLEDLILE